jgi:ribosomal-protein-alanine N-acetyltransferase
MSQNYIIKTARLGFRAWKENDLEAFAKINADKEVMHYFPNVLTKEQTKGFIARLSDHHQKHGFCFYAVDLLETKQLIGFIGFTRTNFESFFTPCVEIGWRLDAKVWNKGLATEGALACLDYGFNTLNFEAIYSFTPKLNLPSERIMQKIGMQKVGEFEHPLLEDEDVLKSHLLYKIEKQT